MNALDVLRNNAVWAPTPVEVDEALKAVAAVAELIEAIRLYCFEVVHEGGAEDYRLAAERLDVALARVGGAA